VRKIQISRKGFFIYDITRTEFMFKLKHELSAIINCDDESQSQILLPTQGQLTLEGGCELRSMAIFIGRMSFISKKKIDHINKVDNAVVRKIEDSKTWKETIDEKSDLIEEVNATHNQNADKIIKEMQVQKELITKYRTEEHERQYHNSSFWEGGQLIMILLNILLLIAVFRLLKKKKPETAVKEEDFKTLKVAFEKLDKEVGILRQSMRRQKRRIVRHSKALPLPPGSVNIPHENWRRLVDQLERGLGEDLDYLKDCRGYNLQNQTRQINTLPNT
jgi:hypothetical protein